MINPLPLNCTHYAMLYPQNGYHLMKLVTVDCCDVTSPYVLTIEPNISFERTVRETDSQTDT